MNGLGTPFAVQRCHRNREIAMLARYLPFLVFDAALDHGAANFSLWQLMQREPVIFVMDEKSAIRIVPQ
jgi:hypothetical protein